MGDTKKFDEVKMPAHYTSGKIQVLDFIEDQQLGYHLGNVIKYVCRAGKKNAGAYKQDLKKAMFMLARVIEKDEELINIPMLQYILREHPDMNELWKEYTEGKKAFENGNASEETKSEPAAIVGLRHIIKDLETPQLEIIVRMPEGRRIYSYTTGQHRKVWGDLEFQEKAVLSFINDLRNAFASGINKLEKEFNT